MTQQAMDFERMPEPAPEPITESCDIPALIEQEHKRAELRRLDEGWPGCGCLACQELYKTIDLEKYGSRVKRYGSVIDITEQQGGGGSFTDSMGEVIRYVDGVAYGTLSSGQTIPVGREAIVKAVIADPEYSYGVPAFDQFIELERKIIQKESDKDGHREFRTTSKYRAGKRGLQRTKPTGYTANKLRHFRPTKANKGLPDSLPNPHQPGLPSKRSPRVAKKK